MGDYKGCLEGVQADQDFCRVLFGLQHFYTRKQCCHYCGVIQWTSLNPAPGESNNPNDLYTNIRHEETRGKLDPAKITLFGTCGPLFS